MQLRLHLICTNFEKVSGVPEPTRAHSTRPDDDDVFRVATVFKRDRILDVIQGRRHSSHVIPATTSKAQGICHSVDKPKYLTCNQVPRVKGTSQILMPVMEMNIHNSH